MKTSAVQIKTQAVSPLFIEYSEIGAVGLSIPANVELSGIVLLIYSRI